MVPEVQSFGHAVNTSRAKFRQVLAVLTAIREASVLHALFSVMWGTVVATFRKINKEIT